jgi:hypothetical protein
MKSQLYILSFILSICLFVSSCTREPIPPPEPVINYVTIEKLRELYQLGMTTVDTNIYIRGIITLTPEYKKTVQPLYA